MISYLDACPSCPPGIPDAAPSLGNPEPAPGGILTDHQCGMCGTAWTVYWRDGWPVDRLIAPVGDGDAEIHQGILAEALTEQDREARHAAA